MALFNYATKELTAKVVYYGPGLCGKTTNLQWIHEKVPIKNKGKMLSLATETDRTLFFDFLPIELGAIRGMKVRVQLYTVPGQVFYNATRRMVLKGADCVVFVCDSQEPVLEANAESLENLRDNLEANEIDPDTIPMVMQYNKRDLPNALPIEILNERLNPRGVPHFEAVALKGVGVEETLKAVTGMVFRSLAGKYGESQSAAAGTSPGTAPGGRPAPPTPSAASPPPPPAAKPAPRPPASKPAASPLPALNLDAAAEHEDLLESLELEPAPEAELDLGTQPEEVLAEELSFEEEPVPVVARSARAEARPSGAAASPFASGEPEFGLELEGDAEDLPLEVVPLEVSTAPPKKTGSATLPAGTRRPVASAESPQPAAAARPTVQAAPISVQVQGQGGTDVAIPIEITLDGGQARLNIQLRLTLDVRVRD